MAWSVGDILLTWGFGIQEQLKVFYSLCSPERSSRIEVIIRAFEQRGGDQQALKELNEELKEVRAFTVLAEHTHWMPLTRTAMTDDPNRCTVKT